jgi:3-methyl-2-oxobutanoate hydroxymethyltransferase
MTHHTNSDSQKKIPEPRKKVTLKTLNNFKKKSIPVSFVTSYDYPTAYMVNEAGVDMILVGDSGGMTMLGYPNTLPVTMDEMLHFTKAVTRANKHAFVVGDMPFRSYQISNEEAVRNACSFIAEGGCDAVKLEGGARSEERIKAIVDAGIPVMGHLGVTPQSLSALGGYRVQGKTLESFEEVLEDALAVQEAGASFLLLEAMPEESAGLIRDALQIPVYGIGAGGKLDGQLLIVHDLLGTFIGDIEPKFAKKYLNGRKLFVDALKTYHTEVKTNQFPSQEHLYELPPEEKKSLVSKMQAALGSRMGKRKNTMSSSDSLKGQKPEVRPSGMN